MHELRAMYREALKGIVSKDDLSPTQIKQLIEYAQKQELNALKFIDDLLKANPGTTFEYWCERLADYRDAQNFIRWAAAPPQEITHRIRALAHLLKVDAGEAKPIVRKDQKPKGLEKGFDSLNKKSIKYKEPTSKDYKLAISLLEQFPKAKALATEKLEQLTN